MCRGNVGFEPSDDRNPTRPSRGKERSNEIHVHDHVIAAAQQIGKTIAERAQAAGVTNVVFDRGGYLYHGRVKALLDATREAGLNKGEAGDDPKKEDNGNKE